MPNSNSRDQTKQKNKTHICAVLFFKPAFGSQRLVILGKFQKYFLEITQAKKKKKSEASSSGFATWCLIYQVCCSGFSIKVVQLNVVLEYTINEMTK